MGNNEYSSSSPALSILHRRFGLAIGGVTVCQIAASQESAPNKAVLLGTCATNVAAPLMQGVGEAQLPLGGYRSSNAFFNFETKRTDSNAFLYAPRMRTPSTH